MKHKYYPQFSPDDSCGCGHEHQHDECAHEHQHDECGCEQHHEECGCGHHHEEIAATQDPAAKSVSPDAKTKTYILENLGCANCAAKMETKIHELAEVQGVTITFATKQMRLTANNPDHLIGQITDICNHIEDGIQITAKDDAPKAKPAKEKSDLPVILIGAALFITVELLKYFGVSSTITISFCVAAYILLGGKIVLAAFGNLFKGQVMDENFLMSIATIGAFIIGDYPEAVGVMLFYRVGKYFEDVAVAKSRSQIMDVIDMRPEVVNRVVGERIETIPAADTQIGDILLVRPGDRIPLDGTIVEGESRIDTSAITGEPVPVGVRSGDAITSGCLNTSGQLKIRVAKPLAESMVTRILDSVENAAASKPKIDRFITRFARIYTPVVVAIAVATAIIPSLVTGNWSDWIYTALTFLVISCPCALVLSVPLAFFCGIGAGSKRGILFKGGVSLEALNNVTTVVMDKTGTVTEGNFVLQEVLPVGHFTTDQLLALAAGCEQNSTHPIAVSIVNAAKQRQLELTAPAELEEIAGHGIRALINEDEILCGNRRLMETHAIDLSAYQQHAFGAEVLIAVNGVFAGHILIADTVKPDAKSSIALLKKNKIITAMLTGDSQNSADAIAQMVGIDEVHARLLPEDKVNALVDIRKQHGAVMFVGDGINDAPVLAGADVGAAMGSGADAAIEAADVVYMTSQMSAIPQSLTLAKASCRIALQNVVFALAVKIVFMVLGLCGFASMWLAVFADTGVAFLCILNSIRILYKK